MPATKLEHALEAVRRGFAVFPVVPNAKKAAIKNWPNLATTDESQICQWWQQNPDYNIGGTTAGKLAIDIDPRNGGRESFAELTLLYAFPKTLRSSTAGGGDHVVYALPPHTEVSNGAGVLGAGIDIRGDGGYIVLPGSTVDGKAYAWGNDHKPALAPPEIVALCKARRPKDDTAGKRLVEEDDAAVDLAMRYLETQAPRDVSEGNRDGKGFEVAARLYDFGISRRTCIDLLANWNWLQCHPPLEADDIQRIAASGECNRGRAIGCAHPNAPGFEAVEIAERRVEKLDVAEPLKGKFYWLRADAAARKALATSREPLVENIMNCESEAVLIGAPGGGKTFGVLDLCYHGAKGLPWAGNATRQGAYIYVAAEAQEGINSRIVALEAHYGPLGDTPLFVIPVAPDLAHGAEDTRALITAILAIEQQCGQKVRLVVIDTLARAISGGDENSSKDMGAVINATRAIRTHVKCASLVVHHPGKDATRGGRGHSNVFGAVDTEMRLTKGTLKVTKYRDGITGHEVRFDLVPIHVGTDAKGKAVSSCFVRIRQNGEPIGSTDMTPAEEAVLTAIDCGLADKPEGFAFNVQNVQTWQREIIKNGSDTSPDTCPKRTTTVGHLKSLSEKCWLRKHGYGQWVRQVSETVGKVSEPSV